jgi:hypothetical protein
MATSTLNNKATIAHRKKWIDIYKVSVGCQLCGYDRNPASLCFDHLPNFEKAEVTKNGCSKRSCAGGMFMLYGKKYSVELLIEEVKKCRILCHNCHMECTHKKGINTIKMDNITLEYLFEQLRKETYGI